MRVSSANLGAQPAAPRLVGYQTWNRNLLRNLLGAAVDSPLWQEPVLHLRVSNSELHAAMASALPEADPASVRASFEQMFRREHRDRRFSAAADDLSGWSARSEELPPFFVHLVASCLIASETDGERAYLARLDELCGNGMRNGDTSPLPELWRTLESWLASARDKGEPYRQLVLPTPRHVGWTNIGYSIDLAFPTRRNRDALWETLTPFRERAEGGEQVNMSDVLAEMSRRDRRFDDGFRTVLTDFRTEWNGGGRPIHHAMWSAIREALQPSLAPRQYPLVRLVASWSAGRIRPYLLVRERELAEAMGYSCTPVWGDDDWPFAIAKGTDWEKPVRDLLMGQLGPGWLARDGRAGLLALRATADDLLERVPSRSGAATHLLVRSDSLPQFRDTGLSIQGTPSPSAIEGWVQIRLDKEGKRISASSRHDFLDSEPERISVAPGTGVPVSGGWLVHEGALPGFVGDDVESVALLKTDSSGTPAPQQLTLVGGVWELPFAPYDGSFILRATHRDGATSHLPIRFVRQSGFVAPKKPSEALLTSTFHETAAGVGRGYDDRSLGASGAPSLIDVSGDIGDRLFLGPTVGSISFERGQGFDWEYRLTDGSLKFIGTADHPSMPYGRCTTHKGTARRWKHLFTNTPEAKVSAPPNVLAAYRNAAREAGKFPKDALPPMDLPSYQHEITWSTNPHVHRFEELLAAVSLARQSFTSEMIGRFVRLSFPNVGRWNLRWMIARAWAEAGVLEPLGSWRWSGVRWVIRPPRLVAYEVAGQLRATVVGLMTSSLRQRLRSVVKGANGELHLRASPSPFAPPTIVIEAKDSAGLVDISSRADLAAIEYAPRVSATLVPIAKVLEHVDPGGLPSGADVDTWDSTVGAFVSGLAPEVGAVSRFRTLRDPDRFAVTGRANWWTFSRSWAFLAGAELSRRGTFSGSGKLLTIGRRLGAHLPLPVARTLTVLSGNCPGPTLDESYVYVTPNESVVHSIISHYSAS